MTTTTRRALIAATAVMAVAAVTAPVPAAATARDKVVIREGQRIVVNYPGMGPGAGTENETALPSICRTSPTCTLVPLDVVLPPDFDPATNDFAIQVRLDWETTQLPNNQGQANDLDLFAWDEPEGEDPLARSVGTVVPEIVGLAQPTEGDYNIVVRNSFGNNSGFKLTFRWIEGRLVTPDESQEPEGPAFFESGEPTAPGPPPSGSTGGGGGTPFRAPPFNPNSGGFPSIVPSTPDLSDLGGLDVDEFGLAASSDLRGLLEAGVDGQSGLDLFGQRPVASGPVEPPSAALLWFWFGVAPLLLLGGAAAILISRRPAVMSIRVPAPASAA